MFEWIGNFISGDSDVWGFVVFLVTGHLVGKPRGREAATLVIPYRSDWPRLHA